MDVGCNNIWLYKNKLSKSSHEFPYKDETC